MHDPEVRVVVYRRRFVAQLKVRACIRIQHFGGTSGVLSALATTRYTTDQAQPGHQHGVRFGFGHSSSY